MRNKAQSIVSTVGFNATVCFFILLALLVVLPLKTLPDLSEEATRLLQYTELLIILIFTVEFILRWLDGGRRYLFGWGIIEFLVIGSYYLDIMGLLDFDNSEVLRVFRLLLLMKFVRPFVAPLKKLWRAFVDVGPEIGVFFIVVLFCVYLAGVIFYGIEVGENPNISNMYDALWWAVVTLSTLGYGDITPVTGPGRIVASVLIIMGVLVIAIPAGLLASEMVTHSQNRRLAKRDGNDKKGG